ncbi:MAG: hypothetical protein ACYS6W_04945 [Planctomycetota bacterium]
MLKAGQIKACQGIVKSPGTDKVFVCRRYLKKWELTLADIVIVSAIKMKTADCKNGKSLLKTGSEGKADEK